MQLIIAIPALNEEKTITEVITSIHSLKNNEPARFWGDLEIFVINDGSTDLTEEKAKYAGATVLTNSTTQGLGKVFERAVSETLIRKANIMVTIDGDGQFDPADIPHLIAPILNGEAHFVTCTRFRDRSLVPKMSFAKKWGNRFLAWFLSRMVGKRLTDVACGFRAYSRETLLNLNLFGTFTYTQESLLDLLFKGFQLKEISLRVKGKREFGHSVISKNLFRYGWQSFKIIFRVIRDYKPLRYIGGFGLLLFLIGVGLDTFVLQHYLATTSFTPYKYLGFLGGFLNAVGLLIFVLGLVADMLNRIRMTQEKILYFEKKRFFG